MPATHAIAEGVAAFTAACPPSLIPSVVQDLNTLVGLVGFAITLGVWWQVRSVKRAFRSKARLPALISELDSVCLDLGLAIDSAQENTQALHVLLGHSAGLLAAGRKLGSSDARPMVNAAIAAVHRARRGMNRNNEDWEQLAVALGALKAAETSLGQDIKDMNWE